LSFRIEAEQEQPIEIPAGAVALLMDILEATAAGRGVTIIPENATTQQRAKAAAIHCRDSQPQFRSMRACPAKRFIAPDVAS
jgi:hypothetical protein